MRDTYTGLNHDSTRCTVNCCDYSRRNVDSAESERGFMGIIVFFLASSREYDAEHPCLIQLCLVTIA